jgi:hypothetical protein
MRAAAYQEPVDSAGRRIADRATATVAVSLSWCEGCAGDIWNSRARGRCRVPRVGPYHVVCLARIGACGCAHPDHPLSTGTAPSAQRAGSHTPVAPAAGGAPKRRSRTRCARNSHGRRIWSAPNSADFCFQLVLACLDPGRVMALRHLDRTVTEQLRHDLDRHTFEK